MWQFSKQGNIFNQFGYGVSLDSGCIGIAVFMNDFINNNGVINGLNQGYDNNNPPMCIWDNSGFSTKKNRGNYYANWVTTDFNEDGISDNFYPISGGLGVNRDNFPLMSSFIYYDISDIYVDDDYTNAEPGWGATRFNETQKGINAVVDGGSVTVYNGTYNENLLIKKSVRIFGEDTEV